MHQPLHVFGLLDYAVASGLGLPANKIARNRATGKLWIG